MNQSRNSDCSAVPDSGTTTATPPGEPSTSPGTHSAVGSPGTKWIQSSHWRKQNSTCPANDHYNSKEPHAPCGNVEMIEIENGSVMMIKDFYVYSTSSQNILILVHLCRYDCVGCTLSDSLVFQHLLKHSFCTNNKKFVLFLITLYSQRQTFYRCGRNWNMFCSLLGLLLDIFSRSYCYTVWSAIGSGLLSVCLSVCLSVRPSVRLSVTLCIVALRVGVRG